MKNVINAIVTVGGIQRKENHGDLEQLLHNDHRNYLEENTEIFTSYNTALFSDFVCRERDSGYYIPIISIDSQNSTTIVFNLQRTAIGLVDIIKKDNNGVKWTKLTVIGTQVTISQSNQSVILATNSIYTDDNTSEHTNPNTFDVNSAVNISFDRIKKSAVDVIGMTDEDTTTINYSSNNQIADNDKIKSALEKLDTKIGANAEITVGTYVTATDNIEAQINDIDVALKTTNDNIGNRTYTYNEVVMDNETVTASIEAISTYIHNEDFVETKGYDAFQAITKSSGVNVYTITQDENATTPYTITDGTLIVNNINYFSIRTVDNKPIYKQGFNLKLSGDVVKVTSFNPATREITLNYEPSTDFVVDFLYRYTNANVPDGKLVIGSNIQNIIDNDPTNIAEAIDYNNTTSGLISTNVQGAIDEVDGNIDTLNADVNTNGSVLKTVKDTAENATYTNSVSGLSSTSIKTALDELTNLTKYNSFGVEVLPTLTKNLDGTVTIGSDGIIVFNILANGTGLKKRFANVTGTTLTIPNNTTSYIYCDYNNGTPLYNYTTSPTIFLTEARYSPVVRVTRESSTILHFEEYDQYAVELSNKALYKDIALHGFERQTGLILSTSATRIVSLSAGFAWFGVQSYNLSQIISGTSGTVYEYYLTAGVWSRTLVTSYDSTYYSDGTNRLTLGNNKWVSKYFFRDIGSDTELYYIHGNQYNSQAEAIAEPLPTAPSTLTSHSLYVGKIVIQYNATNGLAYPRSWDTALQSASVTEHNNLGGIQGGTTGEYYHITNTQALAVAGLETPLQALLTDKAESGIPDAEKSKWGLSYNAGTRVFTLTITGSNTYYYVNGRKFTLAVGTYNFTAHANTSGVYYFYFNSSGVATTSGTIWDILSSCQVAYVYYNATTVTGLLAYELHGCNMSSWSHKYHHLTDGTKFGSGGALSGYTPQSDTVANVQFGVASATYYDEDIDLVSDTLVDGSNYRILSRNVAGEWAITTSTLPYLNTLGGTNNAVINSGGTALTELTANDTYFNSYIVLTNFLGINRVLLLSGQSSYTTLNRAQSESVATLNLSGLPVQEFVILWQITFRYRTTYSTTTAKTRIESEPIRVTINRANISGFAGSHNALSGRTDANSHPISAINASIPNAVIFEKSDGTGLGESLDITWNDTTKILSAKNITTEKLNELTLTKQTNGFTISGGTISKTLTVANDANVSGTNTGDETKATIESKLTGNITSHTHSYEPANTNIQSHISNTSNPHSVTKTQVGLGNVDNTSDTNKPVSTAQQTALNLKANVSGQVFTGAISATNLSGTNTGDQTTIVGITGTTAQFNTALTDGDFATLDGSETLTNKTLTSPVINTTATGTGITTAGGASKLVKTDTLGDIYERGNRVAEDFKATSNKPSVFLNGTNAYISIADNDNLDFGTGTFSIITEHLFESGNTTRYKQHKFSGSVGFHLTHAISNKVSFFVTDGTNSFSISSTNAITDGKMHVIGIRFGVDSASSALFIDGIEDTTATKSGTFPTLSKSNTMALSIGSITGTFHKNETRLNRLFNYALSASQMQKYSYDGIAYEDIGGSNAELLINGNFETGINTDNFMVATGATVLFNDTDVDRIGNYNLKMTIAAGIFDAGIFLNSKYVIGKRYRVSFRAKATTNTTLKLCGTTTQPITTTMTQYTKEFIADATQMLFLQYLNIANTIIIDDIIVQKIGCVLDLSSDSIANTGWFDKSGNNLHATYTNALPINLQNYKPRIQGYSADMRGANVASATTITPTGELFHVTGTTAIATINIPYTGFNGSITIIPDGIFTWTTAGNIALAGTAVVSKALKMTYDSTTSKWYPDYIA